MKRCLKGRSHSSTGQSSCLLSSRLLVRLQLGSQKKVGGRESFHTFATRKKFGVQRSPVSRLVWDQEIVSSNLATPTKTSSLDEVFFIYMKFIVYILFSDSIQKYYTGQTQNLENRLREHNNGETASIKNGIPWRVVWYILLDSRAEAMALETKIKKRGAARFLNDVSRGA